MDKMDVKKTNDVKYEFVAPDGGWGNMIVLGAVLNLISLTGFLTCFGMLYKELFDKINMDSTSITIFNGVSAFCTAMSGFIVNSLLKLMTQRKVGLLGALVFNLGMFGTVFVSSKPLFFLCQGIFQALGNGILFNLTCTMINSYFVKRRLLAFSITQTIVAVAGLVLPQLVSWSLRTYGYRGTLLLLNGISFQNIVGTALMQPVAWHMKKVEVPDSKENELKLLLKDDINHESSYKLQKSEHSMDASNEQHLYKDLKLKESKTKIFISQFIDLSLIKPFLLSNACIGIAFGGFLDITFIMLLPQALYFMGWNENEVARALSLVALGDLVTRIAFILMNNVFLKVGSHETFVVGLVIACITRLGMLWSDNKMVMMVFITLMGISRCTVMALMPVVVADSVGPDKYPAAFGLALLTFGISNWTVGPIIGAIRDMTNNYKIAFYIISALFGVLAITWTFELIYKKKKRNITKFDASVIT